MEQTRNINLPIIGMVQHGIQVQNPNGTKRAKELGHFIAKIQDDFMQKFLQKFDELYTGKKYIEIEFVNENPLTKKFVRYNQGGETCHCLEGQTTGSQKTKDGWKPVECNAEQCQYRQKNNMGKTACNRIGWLKFFIPSISTDRIWLMKITGQTSINRLDTYINVQKSQGNSLKGRYILFLKQEEQESKTTGQKFNNYILDILRKEDFLLEQTIPKTSEKVHELSTTNTQNVNNEVVKQEENTITEKNKTTNTKVDNNKTKMAKKSTATIKKETKTKPKKDENIAPANNTEKTTESDASDDPFKDCYVLLDISTEILTNKKGEQKEYLIGQFVDRKDNIINVVIRPEDSAELEQCNLGTVARLNISEIGGRKFAMKLEYVEKTLKKVAA